MLGAYGRLFAVPHVRPLVAASVLARLSIGMVGLALVLFVSARTGSFGAAGGVAAAFAVASGITSPLQGRLVDRLGQTRVLLPSVLVHAGALAGVVALGRSGAPIGALAAVAAVAGGATPPASAALRPLWPELVSGAALMAAAYAVDAILIEVVFVAGPLLTGLLTATAGAEWALLAAAAAVLAGTLWFSLLEPSRTWRSGPRAVGWAGALVSPGLRTLIAAGLPIGAGLGAGEVALPAFGVAHGSASLGGPLIAVWSVGSGIGGLLYGALGRRIGRPDRAWVRLALATPALTAVMLAPSSLAAMLVVAPLAGLGIAPVVAVRNEVVNDVAPAGTLTEAFTWVLMSTVVGVSVGNALAGALIDTGGWRLAMAAGVAAAALGGLLAWWRRATVRPVARASAAVAGRTP